MASDAGREQGGVASVIEAILNDTCHQAAGRTGQDDTQS
jgi:hypothetical protein